jgi:L-threonylcarbamoyladenylate synthase
MIKDCMGFWRDGQVVAIPTETVYGLAADATLDKGVAHIFALKNRPVFNPLIIHVATLERAQKLVVFSPQALEIAKHFWPGPLTLVLKRQENCPISLLASAGLDTIAIRIPAHAKTLELLLAYETPIAAPSANLSNTISPTTADDVRQAFGDAIPLIIDGGPCGVGLESTILDLSSDTPVLLRPGGTSVEALEPFFDQPIERPHPDSIIKAPGMLKRHYAPSIPLRMNVTQPKKTEAVLDFGGQFDHAHLDLSPKGSLEEAAANLFSMMRQLDRSPFTGIAVAPIPLHGLGLAINDRLSRAAATS